MHDSVRSWIETQARRFFTEHAHDERTRVLEVGSLNVNGGVRQHFDEDVGWYVGTDQFAGLGVDLAVSAEELVNVFAPGAFDLVLSTEMLEHAVNWQLALLVMKKLTKPFGTILLTTRSPGFPYHPGDPFAPYEDVWRFSAELLSEAFERDCAVEECSDDPEAPGVFVRARRLPVSLATLHDLEAERVELPGNDDAAGVG